MSRIEIQLLGFEQRGGGRYRAVDHIRIETAAHVPGEFAGLDFGQIEHVVNQLGEALAFTDDDAKVLDHLLLGLLHLAIVAGDQREEPLFETAANDFCKAQNRGERRAQFVADGREEGTLRGIGFFRRGASLAGFLEELGVVERHAHRRGDGRQQTLIGFGEAAFLIGGLHADDADDLAARGNRHSEVRGRTDGRSARCPPGTAAIHVLVDEQGLAGADDLRSEAGAEGARLRLLAEGVGEVEHHGGAIEQRDVGDGRVEEIADLVADELDQRLLDQVGWPAPG